MFKGISKGFNLMKLNRKILLFNMLAMFVSFFISMYLYQGVYEDDMYLNVGEVSIQTLESLATNIQTSIDTVNISSKILLSDKDIQLALNDIDIKDPFPVQKNVTTILRNHIDGAPMIDSIYLFGNDDLIYSATRTTIKRLAIDHISEAVWYKEVIEHNGSYEVYLNAGNIFAKNANDNYISLIREINDLETYESLGIMVINIPSSYFENNFNQIIGTSNEHSEDTQIMLINQNKEIIAGNSIHNIDKGMFWQDKDSLKSWVLVKELFGGEYLISGLRLNINDWSVISIREMDEKLIGTTKIAIYTYIILLMNGLLIFLIINVMLKKVTQPVYKLLNHMKKAESGNFEAVDLKTSTYEMSCLGEGYNSMIIEIQKLMENIIVQQNVRRKLELNALQEQIKPHFLYNTLDTISALSLLNRPEDVYLVSKSLGGFCRTLLSNGDDMITIKEEIGMVKKYLDIQKIRYCDQINVVYDIDEDINNVLILKMIVQPLVENTIYHGIRPSKRNCNLFIGARMVDDRVEIKVKDDGVGMSDECIHSIMCETMSSKTSFGLRAVIARLRNLYNRDDIIKIESKIGEGTDITLFLGQF